MTIPFTTDNLALTELLSKYPYLNLTRNDEESWVDAAFDLDDLSDDLDQLTTLRASIISKLNSRAKALTKLQRKLRTVDEDDGFDPDEAEEIADAIGDNMHEFAEDFCDALGGHFSDGSFTEWESSRC